MKKVAILQSNYIPWKGYFDMIAAVDELIIFDDMQYTRRDWRNRNRIKTPQGIQWLSVPVKVKGKYYQSIRETELENSNWNEVHWKTLKHNYQKAPCFNEIASWLEPLYLQNSCSHISVLNQNFIKAICNYLGIQTKITNSGDYNLVDGKTERLVSLVMQAGGGEYISGTAAQDYIQKSVFDEQSIKLTWFDYDNYPEYQQLWGDFEHKVSILDLLFNCGEYSSSLMKYVKL